MTDAIQQTVIDGGERLAARFWAKVDVGAADECWPWTAAKLPSGYGYFSYKTSRATEAHRVAYILTNGPIPEGLQIDHRCRNRGCCNPQHLEAVTPVENTRRGEPANRTHCPRGHAYDEANTYLYRGGRKCRRCHREREREARANGKR